MYRKKTPIVKNAKKILSKDSVPVTNLLDTETVGKYSEKLSLVKLLSVISPNFVYLFCLQLFMTK